MLLLSKFISEGMDVFFVFSGLLFMVGLIGLVSVLKLREKQQKKLTALVGISDKIENKTVSFSDKPETFADMFESFGVKDSKFMGAYAKITFSYQPKGIFIQDNNPRTALFINRRRTRKNFLKDGDLIDAGGLKFMFIDGHSKFGFEGPRTLTRSPNLKDIDLKIPEHLPNLTAYDSRKKSTILNKNVTYIGKSETNDIVIKVRDVAFKHAVIQRISDKYKLTDLRSVNGTYINGKKYDEKFLEHGDEIAFDTAKYRFMYSVKP